MGPESLDELCPDWRERETFLSGPRELIDATVEHFEREELKERLHLERFQPVVGGEDVEEGEGGKIRFLLSDTDAESDGTKPILVAGEEAGLDPAVRLPRGHLPHVRREALLGQGPRPADRQGARPGRPARTHLHQRPRGPDRDFAVTDPGGHMTARHARARHRRRQDRRRRSRTR